MEVRYPAYYYNFHCLASKCPDSCCKEWAVAVDPESAARYQALPGSLGDDLRSVMQMEDGDTILRLTSDGRCPMWRQDGLCRIQAQLGEEALCYTCRQFPRLRHDYGDFVELGLELSCPEAARLIFSGADSLCSTAISGGESPEYDADAMSTLLRSRAEVLAFLKCRDFTVGQALAVILLYSYAVQEELDGGEVAVLSPAALLKEAAGLASNTDIGAVLRFYQDLEILTPAWRQNLQSPDPIPWTDAMRSIAKYFVLRYWLQAVSDYDLIARVKLTVVSCLVIKTVGGNLLETAQRYSKEIENDADNVDAILDGAYTSPALADIGLLGLLLEDERF